MTPEPLGLQVVADERVDNRSMPAALLALSLLGIVAFTHAQPLPADLPTETDTVNIGRTVVVLNVRGGIFRKDARGELVPVSCGESVEPGDVLLVLRNAGFSIGSTTLGPESHGDRWVQFE